MRPGTRRCPQPGLHLAEQENCDELRGTERSVFSTDRNKRIFPKGASPDAIVSALLERETRGASKAHPRRHERKRWYVELSIKTEETAGNSRAVRKLRVTTQDLSRGGYSFLCRQFIYPGTLVHARVTALPGKPLLTGTVANCIYAGAGQHRVGVKLLTVNI